MASKLKSGVFFEPVPFTDAAAWIRGKTPVTRAAWDAMLPELRGRAFLVTGIEDLNLLQEIRDIASELPEGADYHALKDRIAGKLLQSPHFNEKSAARRAELILRHNGFAAYSAQDFRHMKETADTFPYWQYRTMGDEAVRESHAALHGLTLRHDDPFWLDHFPPWEWGCRCQVVNVGEEEFEEIKRLRTAGNFNPVFEEKTKGWTLPDEGLKVLHEQNLLFDGGPNPKGVLVESKEMFKPGDLAIPAEELKNRYDPEDWAAFEAKAKATDIGDGRTVWEWMNGVPAPAPQPTPQPTPPPTYAIDPADPVCTALQCKKGPPLSIEEAVKETNPHYADGPEYQENCQRCVQAYELLRRGYRVEAKAKPGRGVRNLAKRGDEMFGNTGLQYFMRADEVRAAIAGVAGDARFIVYVQWDSRTAHVFTAERTAGGTVRFLDPQSGKLDVSDYFTRGMPGRFGLLRVDNLPINGGARILTAVCTPPPHN